MAPRVVAAAYALVLILVLLVFLWSLYDIFGSDPTGCTDVADAAQPVIVDAGQEAAWRQAYAACIEARRNL